MIFRTAWRASLTGAAILACAATMASAKTIDIKVTNNQGAGGLAITPLYIGLHDGGFDAFDVGAPASPGIEEIAETGSAATVAGERVASGSSVGGAVLASPSGPPPVEPGETVRRRITLNSSSAVYLTYLSMVLPSNDTFIGNDDPLANQLLDGAGRYLGDQTIEVTGLDIYDAGTELNGLFGSAFVAGQDITQSPADTDTNIRAGESLAVFAGQQLATGAFLGSASQIDFLSDPANFSLVTIEISEVPLPASAPLLLGALGWLGWRSRRKA